MFHLPPHFRLTLALTCALMVALRIAGAHLHLCYDGSEPPVSFHVADVGPHHGDQSHAEDSAGFAHTDRDVSVSGDYLSKKLAANVDPSLLLLALTLLLFFVPRVRTLLPVYSPPASPGPARMRRLPPPRGPPVSL